MHPSAASQREAARDNDTGRFGPQAHSAPESALTDPLSAAARAVHGARDAEAIPGWVWDNDDLCSYTSVENIGLKQATPDMTASATAAVYAWMDQGSPQPPAADVALDEVTISMQPSLMKGALQHYADTRREPDDTYDDEVSFYGAEGPLGLRFEDGSIAILDGNHRYAAARLRGEDTFRMQVLDI